jgi:hypothetical protein
MSRGSLSIWALATVFGTGSALYAQDISGTGRERCKRSLLLVPKTSVVTTTERTFVIRDRSGRAEWVDVRKGTADGDLVEVAGDLKAGDLVVQRANDEIREGDATRTSTKKTP